MKGNDLERSLGQSYDLLSAFVQIIARMRVFNRSANYLSDHCVRYQRNVPKMRKGLLRYRTRAPKYQVTICYYLLKMKKIEYMIQECMTNGTPRNKVRFLKGYLSALLAFFLHETCCEYSGSFPANSKSML